MAAQAPLLPDSRQGNGEAPNAPPTYQQYEGLSTAEAQRRLLRDGYNELAEESINPIVMLQLTSICLPTFTRDVCNLHQELAE